MYHSSPCKQTYLRNWISLWSDSPFRCISKFKSELTVGYWEHIFVRQFNSITEYFLVYTCWQGVWQVFQCNLHRDHAVRVQNNGEKSLWQRYILAFFQAWNYTQICLCHSDFSSLFRTLTGYIHWTTTFLTQTIQQAIQCTTLY